LDIRAQHRGKVAVALRSIIKSVTSDRDRVAPVALVRNTQVFTIRRCKPSFAFDLHKLSSESSPIERTVERQLGEAAWGRQPRSRFSVACELFSFTLMFSRLT
jgi:hypothetical protein